MPWSARAFASKVFDGCAFLFYFVATLAGIVVALFLIAFFAFLIIMGQRQFS
jgi:hypothetical protein